VEAAEQAWRPLGELLLSKNLIARTELDQALTEQEETGKLLGAILVDRGYISGPALAIALAEQYGVALDQQQGFGTGLWAEIERRHRSERGIEDPEESQAEATVVKLEPPQPSLEAVPDPEPKPDPQLQRLEEKNRRLQDEIGRLHAEFTKLRVIEPDPDPELERLGEENHGLQEEIERLRAELAQPPVVEPDPELERLAEENHGLGDEIERLQAELTQLRVTEPDPELERLAEENRGLQEEIERLRAEFTKLRVVEAPEPEAEPPSSHLLFVPTPARYLLVERQGPPPGAGDELTLSEGRFVVGKLGPAPIPGERRACAFLLAHA